MRNTKKHRVFIECIDHTVSKEVFTLYHDEELDMLITSPQPKGEELAKYYQSENYISHTDSERSFFEKVYQLVKSFALRKKVALITRLLKKEGTVLDIGCGTGDFLVQAKKEGWSIYGTEPNQDARELAIKKGVTVQESSTILENEQFDVITMWHVLEHVPNINDQFAELKRLVKPDGYIIVAVPNFKSYDAKYYDSFWAAYDVPRHFWHFSKNAIRQFAKEHQMNVIDVLPMKFDSFYVSLLSEKYKTSKMNYIKALWIGLRSNWKAKKTKEYSSLIYVIKNQ